MARHPLSDLVILDFSRVLAGPLATMQLADHGATVIKVERPGNGDDTRAWGPPYDDRGVATYFLSVNRNKHSVALDLSREEDLAAARALAAQADVVVENFRPGVMERLGLSYDDLVEDNPGLLYCSVTGFGRETEAAAAMPGYDLLVQALGGLMSITGAPDGEPQKVGVALVDVITGLFTVSGILTALRHRDRTGEGQRIELNLLSCLLAALVNQASAHTAGGVVPQRMGNAHPSIAPYEVLTTGAGDLVLAVGNDRQFTALANVLELPELAVDERFSTNTARVAHRAVLRATLEQRLATAPASTWAPPLLEAGVPAGEVNDVAGAFALAERLGLAPTASLTDEQGHEVHVPANPVRLSRTPARTDLAPPALGSTSIAEALDLVARAHDPAAATGPASAPRP